jgi:hypothetical protein
MTTKQLRCRSLIRDRTDEVVAREGESGDDSVDDAT